MMNMPPDGFEDVLMTRVITHFSLRARLRLFFGYPLQITIHTAMEHDAGATKNVATDVTLIRPAWFPRRRPRGGEEDIQSGEERVKE